MQTNPESAAVEAVAWLLTGPECAEGTTPYALTRNPDDLHSLSTMWTAEALYTQSALDALRGEVAENEGVIRVWRRRCEEAERRVAELTSLLSDTAGNLRRMADDEFADCDQVRLEHVVNRIYHALTKESP